MIYRLVCCLLFLIGAPLHAADESSVMQTLTYTLGPLKIDRLMAAMHGPVLKQQMQSSPPVWIKSMKVEVINGAARPEAALEFLCHAWMKIGAEKPGDERLLTVSQGMEEMKLPPGYGIRLDNLAEAQLSAQALNDNSMPETDVSYRVTVRYIPGDAAEKLQLQNLRTVTAAIMAQDAVKTFMAAATVGDDGKLCATKGVSFLVPPGRHEYATELDHYHPLLRGGTIHAIKLHLHAYGRAMSLVDKTTGKTLWHGQAENAVDKALITRVDDYNGVEGIAINPKHRYAVTAVYDNPTKHPVEAMAVLRLYLSSP